MVRAFACGCGLAGLLTAALFGQTATPTSFTSADVHAISLSRIGDNMSGGVLRAGRYEIRSATMVDLIRLAYGIDSERILGGPSWLETDRFDVIATAPDGATPDTAKTMLQALLADRFGLAVRTDNRPVPVYVLSMGKGNKMKAAAASGAPGCQGQPQGPPAPGVIPAAIVACHGMSMDRFAESIRQMANAYIDHTVVNQTKLEGEWDFDMTWTPRGALAAAGADGISVFDAIDKQLGLKLERQQAPLPVLVVEKVNEKPTPNAAGISQPEEKVEFEAADIKLAPPDTRGTRFLYQPGGRINGEGTLSELISLAFSVPPNLREDTLVGLPKFADASRYEIVAKTPSAGAGAATHDAGRDTPPPLSVALVMLQNLLKERFKLATHDGTQSATVYALVVGKGTKMTHADDAERARCRPDPNAAPPSTNGTLVNTIRCQNTTMTELAKNLANWAGAYIDHPVVNATGLTGGYDFVLSWTPKVALHPAQPTVTGSGAAADPGGLSIFEAVESQLGLKLDVQKHAIPVIVVDHLEEKPTDD